MIYVASQEGLPGFLFHLQKKALRWNVIRELGIKLTAAFCFPRERASPSDSGIWALHRQPGLGAGRDRLEKGHGEGNIVQWKRLLSWILHLSCEDVFGAAGFRRQPGSRGMGTVFLSPHGTETRHSTAPLCPPRSFTWRGEQRSLPMQVVKCDPGPCPLLEHVHWPVSGHRAWDGRRGRTQSTRSSARTGKCYGHANTEATRVPTL